MKALCWHGKGDVRVDTVPDPKVENPRDAIVRVTTTCICGSDLHLYDGYMPGMQAGDVLGHEFMGVVEEVGPAVANLKKGDRVIVPFTISCGQCFFCKKGLWSCCDNTNPNAKVAEQMMGHSPAGLFGYSHLTGGYAGGQAEYVRVPFADVGPYKVPAELTDEQVVFLTDILPTGWMGAEHAQIEPGDTVAVWGCGPVGLFAITSAWLMGAGRVIAIDWVPERLALAERWGRAEPVNFLEDDESVYDRLQQMTHGRGPDRCIECVGAEAHGTGGVVPMLDRMKAFVGLATDRPNPLRQAIMACRKGGTVSVPGVYIGMVDKFPMGAFMNKGLTMKTGQTHVKRYLDTLTDKIRTGEIDTTGIITHRAKLADAPKLYETFRDKKDGCVKVVLTP